jgi:hypothetical protein
MLQEKINFLTDELKKAEEALAFEKEKIKNFCEEANQKLKTVNFATFSFPEETTVVAIAKEAYAQFIEKYRSASLFESGHISQIRVMDSRFLRIFHHLVDENNKIYGRKRIKNDPQTAYAVFETFLGYPIPDYYIILEKEKIVDEIKSKLALTDVSVFIRTAIFVALQELPYYGKPENTPILTEKFKAFCVENQDNIQYALHYFQEEDSEKYKEYIEFLMFLAKVPELEIFHMPLENIKIQKCYFQSIESIAQELTDNAVFYFCKPASGSSRSRKPAIYFNEETIANAKNFMEKWNLKPEFQEKLLQSAEAAYQSTNRSTIILFFNQEKRTANFFYEESALEKKIGEIAEKLEPERLAIKESRHQKEVCDFYVEKVLLQALKNHFEAEIWAHLQKYFPDQYLALCERTAEMFSYITENFPNFPNIVHFSVFQDKIKKMDLLSNEELALADRGKAFFIHDDVFSSKTPIINKAYIDWFCERSTLENTYSEIVKFAAELMERLDAIQRAEDKYWDSWERAI